MFDNFKNVSHKKGKNINIKSLGRDIEWIKKAIRDQKKLADLFINECKKRDKCPICKCEDYDSFVKIYNFFYLECRNCGHLFSQLVPLEIKDIYSNVDAKRSFQDQLYANKEVFEKRLKKIIYPKIKYCEDNIKCRKKWIDVGCGAGELLVGLKKRGWEVGGIEIDPIEVKFARQQGLKIYKEDIYSFDIGKLNNVGVVSMINILEHLEDPFSIVKKILDSCNSLTYFVVEVPFHPSLSSFVSSLFPKLAYRHIYPPEHLNIFTEKSIEIMLKMNNLKLISVWQFGQDFQNLIYSVMINEKVKENCLFDKIIDLSNSIQFLIDKLGFSDTLFFIAQKQ